MNKLILYHYSNKKLDNVKVSYFGNNSFTFNDVKACKIKRSFFYTDDNYKEAFFYNSGYKHIISIDKKLLYDLQTDKDKLKARYRDITSLLLHCKRYYKGIIYNVGYEVISLFYDVRVKEVIQV